MLRILNNARILKNCKFQNVIVTAAVPKRNFNINGEHIADVTDEEFVTTYVDLFNRPEIDGWEVRRVMHRLHGEDAIPDPSIICAALKACRRVSDYSLGIRYLETVRLKCESVMTTLYPYIVKEISPTLEELGLELPEQIGYDKPELALIDVDDIH